ncbi:hypothetical protein UA08_02063 [Talaromyces atroroseus]|uniref:Uncharacterized protein n=1 Tax=Talaromyces atroroseus TaxID=1441469 RepID=A0A1Q5QAL9_TALAT|nr:hypothetical protein UA08_02063 [Talaromyces atroroseus]OKL62975.1 hypothetical protein UA08_02063 [Talaromyces atroroseus]
MACFIHLRDNVPSWISDVNQLSVHIHNKRAEFAAEAAKAAAASPSPLRRRKSVSSSLSTNRTQKSLLEPPSTGHRLKRLLSRESLRGDGLKRRRPASPQSGDLDAESEITVAPVGKKPPSHIISYDGHTQKILEKMVRDIWTAKSSIRSSRIQSSIQTAFGGRMRMQIPAQRRYMDTPIKCADEKGDGDATIEADQADDDGVAKDLLELRMAMMKERHRRYQIPPPNLYPQQRQQQTRPKHCPYDFVEGQLDSAQNLCETAAYRFLRHGNCLEELEDILRAYEFILEASTSMAEKEEKAAAEAAAAAAAEEKKEEEQKQEEDDNDTIDIEVDDSEDAVDAPTTIVPTLKTKENDFDDSTGILEVDDRSDTSEVSIDITAFRMTRYGQRTMHPFTVNRVP